MRTMVLADRGMLGADMQKDASGASAARGTFWLMRKNGAGNNKKFKKFNEENHFRCGNRTKCMRNCLNNAIDGNYSD